MHFNCEFLQQRSYPYLQLLEKTFSVWKNMSNEIEMLGWIFSQDIELN